jgi:hypothetical protein
VTRLEASLLHLLTIGDSEPDDRYIPATSTSSSRTFDQIEAWLGTCTSDHELCHGEYDLGKAKRPLPTRLLDLSKLQSDAIKLIYSKDLPETIEWMTMSHRWGKSPVITLTSANEEELKTPFTLNKLPILFQDAVNLAHRLGCQYFWIDSLCIKQDDPEDWLHEATAMGDVYAGSLLNLSASHSSHDSSLYCERNPLLITDCIIRPTWTCLDANLLVIAAEGHGGSPLKDEPLLSRGWVFQERLLPPRVLHFGGKQLVWECRDDASCELDPEALLYSNQYGFQKQFSRVFLTPNSAKTAQQVLYFWLEKLEVYSETVTTFEADRLLALAGIAEYISRLTGNILGKYYVGSWEFGMVTQLAWSADPIKPGEQRPVALEKYRAPSWSWASVNGSFSSGSVLGGDDDVKRELAMIFQKSVTPVDSPYGPASTGFIQIWGNMCEMRVLSNSTQLNSDAIQLLPLPEDLDLKELEKQFAAKLELQTNSVSDIFGRRDRRNKDDKDPHQEFLQRQQIIELDRVTFSRQGIYWDNQLPSSEQNLEKRPLYFFPIVLRTQKDSVWDAEIGMLTDDTNPGRDPRKVGSEGFVHFLLTGERLFRPRETVVDLRKPQKHFNSFDSHDVDALILKAVEGEKGRFRRVGFVSMGSMVYSPSSHRQRQDRETGRIIRDVMKRSRLADKTLVYDEASSVYLVEIA